MRTSSMNPKMLLASGGVRAMGPRSFRILAVLLVALSDLPAAAQNSGDQSATGTPPYDFSEADSLLRAQLPALSGHVAVIVQQNGREIYRFQAGDIGYDTLTRMASFTKTVSAAVILALRDEGKLSLDERLGDGLPLLDRNGLGDPTVLDAWGMRHGIDSAIPYEHDSRLSLAESVDRLALFGYLAFAPPGSKLGYDGAGMQAVGRISELRTAESWEVIARSRLFDPCEMPRTDYGQFSPNPSIPGGLRSTPVEAMRFSRMIMEGGVCENRRILSEASIEQLFTNATRGLPVYATPWPASHPLYPYGVDPDYGFGDWVIAENPETNHVEEVVGAGAWGSYLWLDRRRGVSAVLFTDVPAGSQDSVDAALGLFDIVRREIESRQATRLAVKGSGNRRVLFWNRAAGSTSTRIYGSSAPIQDVFDLKTAQLLLETSASFTTVPAYPYYAVIAQFETFTNTALIPGGNSWK